MMNTCLYAMRHLPKPSLLPTHVVGSGSSVLMALSFILTFVAGMEAFGATRPAVMLWEDRITCTSRGSSAASSGWNSGLGALCVDRRVEGLERGLEHLFQGEEPGFGCFGETLSLCQNERMSWRRVAGLASGRRLLDSSLEGIA